jgi:hypothetical protein
MKTTLDVPDDLYRAVKSRSAIEGLTVRSVTLMLYGDWLARPDLVPHAASKTARPKKRKPLPAWFGMGRVHVRKNAGRDCGMEEMREAIAAGVAAERLAQGENGNERRA